MAKNRHHTVPQFYLKGFKSADRRINVLHIATGNIILDASLRDQCYRHKFYGKTDEVENALMMIEVETAVIIHKIIDNDSLSGLSEEEIDLLRYFMALQYTRTPKTVADLMSGADQMTESMRSVAPEGANVDLLNTLKRSEEEVLKTLLSASFGCAKIMSDLALRLVVNKSPLGFITSDDPIVLYNQYCEQLQGMGVAAPAKTGVQLFYPISPRHLLVLFDSSVYGITLLENECFPANIKDVRKVNTLQAVFADKCLLFSSRNDADEIAQILQRSNPFREQAVTVVEYLREEGNPYGTLHHSYKRMPNMNLRLSFLALRRKASKRAISERWKDREHALNILDPQGERFRPKAGVRKFYFDQKTDNS